PPPLARLIAPPACRPPPPCPAPLGASVPARRQLRRPASPTFLAGGRCWVMGRGCSEADRSSVLRCWQTDLDRVLPTIMASLVAKWRDERTYFYLVESARPPASRPAVFLPVSEFKRMACGAAFGACQPR